MSAIDNVREQFDQDVSTLNTDDLKTKYLGRNGLLKELFKGINDIPNEEKATFGADVNALKEYIETQIKELTKKVSSDVNSIVTDITRPPYETEGGTLHPTRVMLKEITEIFSGLGFEIIDDREVETVEYCFDQLRTPDWHPARDSQDTFYLSESPKNLLRTQTTATQPKVLETQKPPFKIISVGKVYRSDTPDATHTPMFHQIDGFMVDEGISLANLKAVLETFVRQFIPKIENIRFRPHYFGYTEPSLEMDVQCTICGGGGCKACKQQGWIEVLGAGMMHPELFENAGHDSEKHTGFAFGFGIERLVMQKYGVDDIRLLFDNDLRLLSQIK